MTQDLAPSRNFCSPSYPLLEGDALLPALTPADLLAPQALHTPGIPGMMKERFPQAPHVCRAWTSHGGRGLQPLPWASSTGLLGEDIWGHQPALSLREGSSPWCPSAGPLPAGCPVEPPHGSRSPGSGSSGCRGPASPHPCGKSGVMAWHRLSQMQPLP